MNTDRLNDERVEQLGAADEEIERRLASVPVRSLEPRREAEMLAAIRSAGTKTPFWGRRIPLWQAAAACAATMCLSVAAMRGTATRAAMQGDDAGAATPVRVALDTAWFAREAKRADVDISQWRPFAAGNVEMKHE